MRKKVLWLRIAYWAGIIADAIVAILMVFPERYVRFYNLDLIPNATFGFGLRRAAPLMAGWTILLLWADRKPVERKDILPITVCPVVVGYITYVVYATKSGFVSLGQMIFSLVTEAVFVALFITGYLKARDIEAEA
jgi:hypothetical protein